MPVAPPSDRQVAPPIKAKRRRHLRRLVEQAIPQLAVCSYNEIAPGISVETIGVVDG